MEVHRELGPGFLESVYEEALAYELGVRGIAHARQVNLPVMYKGKKLKQFVADLVVEAKVIVEIKAIESVGELERAQVINYLRATGLRVGLLVNFGSRSLGWRRVIWG